MTTPAFHFDVGPLCDCAQCTAIRTPTPEHHVETLEIEGPTPVANLVEMCSHGERGDYIEKREIGVDVARFLLAQKHSRVLVYPHSASRGRAASVRAEVMSVTVEGVCFQGSEAYELLLAAKLANDAALEALHAL